MEQEYQDIEFRKYWEIIRKRKKSILIIFLIVFLTGLIFTVLTPKTYESFALIKINRSLFSQAPKITGYKNTIAAQLNEQFNILPSQFDLVDLPSKNLIKIEGRGKTPEEARNMAELVVKTTIDYNEKFNADLISLERRRIEEIEKELKENENYLKKLKPNEISAILIRNQQSSLKDQLADWQSRIDSKIQKLEVSSPASSPTTPSRPNFKVNLTLSFILGLFLGIFWTFSTENLKKTKDF